MFSLFAPPSAETSDGLPCAVCCATVAPHGGTPAMRTKLQNFTTACDFLLKYGVIEPPSMGSFGFRDLCNDCLSYVLSCDSLLSLLWSKINHLQKVHQDAVKARLKRTRSPGDASTPVSLEDKASSSQEDLRSASTSKERKQDTPADDEGPSSRPSRKCAQNRRRRAPAKTKQAVGAAGNKVNGNPRNSVPLEREPAPTTTAGTPGNKSPPLPELVDSRALGGGEVADVRPPQPPPPAETETEQTVPLTDADKKALYLVDNFFLVVRCRTPGGDLVLECPHAARCICAAEGTLKAGGDGGFVYSAFRAATIHMHPPPSLQERRKRIAEGVVRAVFRGTFLPDPGLEDEKDYDTFFERWKKSLPPKFQQSRAGPTPVVEQAWQSANNHPPPPHAFQPVNNHPPPPHAFQPVNNHPPPPHAFQPFNNHPPPPQQACQPANPPPPAQQPGRAPQRQPHADEQTDRNAIVTCVQCGNLVHWRRWTDHLRLLHGGLARWVSYADFASSPGSQACDWCRFRCRDRNDLHVHVLKDHEDEVRRVSLARNNLNPISAMMSVAEAVCGNILEAGGASGAEAEAEAEAEGGPGASRPMTCRHCDERFATQAARLQHIVSHHIRVPDAPDEAHPPYRQDARVQPSGNPLGRL